MASDHPWPPAPSRSTRHHRLVLAELVWVWPRGSQHAGLALPPHPLPPPKATFKLSQWLALAACGLSGPSERSSQRQAGRPPAASLEQAGWTWVLYRASSGYLRYCTSREVVAQSPAGRAENCCLSLSRQPRVRPSTIAQCRPRARIASRPCCPPPSPRQSARSRAVNHEHGRRRRARPRPGLDRRRRLVGAVHAHPRETPRGAYYLPTYLPAYFSLLVLLCDYVCMSPTPVVPARR